MKPSFTPRRRAFCPRDHSRAFRILVTTVAGREGTRRLLDTPSPSSPHPQRGGGLALEKISPIRRSIVVRTIPHRANNARIMPDAGRQSAVAPARIQPSSAVTTWLTAEAISSAT